MRIGLIDVDGHNFPNLPLMKLSAWHKRRGDSVEWYEPLLSGHMDRVYMSKVFSFTPDYEYYVDADDVRRGGTGYCITLGDDGKEHFDGSRHQDLPYEIEHIYPDYEIYYITVPEVRHTAYGFMSRGCPRGCEFCHVKGKEGLVSHKVADLSEFWAGQKDIELMDPNPIACREWRDILGQLIESKARVNFNQGLDIRVMTEEKAEMLRKIRIKNLHFAWDRYEDKDIILPRLQMFRDITGFDRHKIVVYMLCNFGSTFEQDLERAYTLRDLGCQPYVMLYDKEHIPRGHKLRRLQRWCNSPSIFNTVEKFEDYKKK